jgi:putative chitinase
MYLNNQTFLINQSNLERLKIYGESLAAVYAEKLVKVEYTVNNERKKLTAGEAASFIKNLQDKVETHLQKIFQNLISQISEQPTPKPDAVQLPVGVTSVTGDLLRKINPAFTQARANELAAPINRAMVSAQIQNLTAEAMFLAQVVHEIGLNPNLEEDGKNSTKTYGGKKYPYFFYMYDKESPDPDKRQTAKNLGNTEAGDGDKFHGRGFLQLTGRWNYNAAGNYIGKDLISNPELVSNIEIAALSSGWYWHSYRKINSLIKTGSEAEFSAVTAKINPRREGYASRLAFWAKAKQALGVK